MSLSRSASPALALRGARWLCLLCLTIGLQTRCLFEELGACENSALNDALSGMGACESLYSDASLFAALFGLLNRPGITTPILFATQTPVAGKDFRTVAMTFANHTNGVNDAPRGGDLYIRYPDGALRNLTREAGFGSAVEFQGADAIAVREPSVHWDGKKALFSMLIGAPMRQFDSATAANARWQIYEVTGLGRDEAVAIRRIPNQPEAFNNISPIYGTAGRIHFISDRPPNGAEHLYPMLDEYELTPTNTGVWSINPDMAGGDLQHLHHAPSGAFDLRMDSAGRLIFTIWEHAQQDIFANEDMRAFLAYRAANGTGAGFDLNAVPNRSVNFASENGAAAAESVVSSYYNFATDLVRDLSNGEPFYPPQERPDQLNAGPLQFQRQLVKHFLTWQMNEDGTEVVSLNHLGPHELHYFQPAMYLNEPALRDGSLEIEDANPNPAAGPVRSRPFEQMMHASEDPDAPGCFYFTNAHHFDSFGGGQIGRLCAPPDRNADQVYGEHITHPATRNPPGPTPPAGHTGLYRTPIALPGGALVASHAVSVDTGRFVPDFALKLLAPAGGFMRAGETLNERIPCNVRYFTPDTERRHVGPCWELWPTAVMSRPIPAARTAQLPAIEAAVFAAAGVDFAEFTNYLRQRNLAMFIVRNVTRRDDADRQQPFNLKVAGSTTQSVAPDFNPAAGHRIYEIEYFQVFMGELRRGAANRAGRRILPTNLARTTNAALRNLLIAENGADTNGVRLSERGFPVAPDGSTVGIVPANRALSWQSVSPAAQGLHPVVKEQTWVSFRAGEVRVCASCHGVNERDQTGAQGDPTNTPLALEEFLQIWNASH